MKAIITLVHALKQKKLHALVYCILLLLLITLPVVIYVFIYQITDHSMSLPLIILLFMVYLTAQGLGIYITLKYFVAANKEISASRDELALKDVIIQHTDEIIILLDMYGKILSINPTLSKILNFTKEDLINQPFRTILFEKSFEDTIRIKDILLSRFKDVFKGYEAEVVLPCRIQHYADIKSISFKLLPIASGSLLQYIVAIGRVIQLDYLTSHYLKREYAEYTIDNNIRTVNLLSYRLTRNLESVMDKREITRIQLGLQEAVINAIEHGNLEIDFDAKTNLKKRDGNYWDHVLDCCNKKYLEDRKIKIQYYLLPNCVKYIITDEGKGFNWRNYSSLTSDHNLIRDYHGVGLTMLKDIFEISFNEKGNKIILIKYFSRER